MPRSTEPPTTRQKEILRFIVDYVEKHGYPPTLREICEQFKITSTNGANDLVKALERKGYVAREPLKSRGIRVLRGPDEPPFPLAAPPADQRPSMVIYDGERKRIIELCDQLRPHFCGCFQCKPRRARLEATLAAIFRRQPGSAA